MVKSYRIALSADFVRLVLDYNPQTGVLVWRQRLDRSKQWNTRYASTVAGYISNGYRYIQIDGRVGYGAHRLAWLHYHGTWPPEQIDHANGIRDDNRITNLRAANNSENNCNRGPQSNNHTSGVRGVSFHKPTGKWAARLVKDGQSYSLGLHFTIEEAAKARREAERALHGNFMPNHSNPTRCRHPRDKLSR